MNSFITGLVNRMGTTTNKISSTRVQNMNVKNKNRSIRVTHPPLCPPKWQSGAELKMKSGESEILEH